MKKTLTRVLAGGLFGGLLLFIWVTLQGTRSPLYGRWVNLDQTRGESAMEFYPNGRCLTEDTDGGKTISTYRIVNNHQIAFPGLFGSETICEYSLIDPYLKPPNPHPSNVQDLEIRCSESYVQTYMRGAKGPQFADRPPARLF